MGLDKKYNITENEKKWQDFWENERIFKFNPNTDKEIFSLDTPPPTVSGIMHIGHAMGYSQADFAMRFHRMLGKEIFYPFGFDDNGLATERFVEKKAKVRGNSMSRKEFKELCLKVTKETEDKLRQKWKSLGISPDWNQVYRTIDDNSQRISQLSFIELYEKGREYQKEAPTLWCPHCRTAIAQVELEDKELQSFFNDIVFRIADSDEEIIISTTRPELLPACVAVFVHPEDEKHMGLVGKKAKVPLFDFEVPILSDERVDMEKGSGIVMCCTFGDLTDMEWYYAYNLPLKVAIDTAGRMTDIAGKYKGMMNKEARKAIIEDLKDNDLLRKQEQITHVVNVHERCGHEIEIIHTKQWFIKYLDLKDKFIELGRQIEWHPKFMRHRYENWIKGLQWDWCISRQRFHGVPFPVWYCEKCGEKILANKEDLPVDPLIDKPPLDKCPKCGYTGFVPEEDVMDTWATSALTPMIATDWDTKKSDKRQLFDKIFPYSLRANGHDIISFWLFNAVVKSYLHENRLPWKVAMINGWVLDEHGRKMSKSKGNVVDPMNVLDRYGADALRYWAASKKFGEDVNYSEKELSNGKKTVVKLWNAARFALMHLEDYEPINNVELSDIDKWVLSELNTTIKNATKYLKEYDFSKAKAEIERFFWNVFCDNYLEIVKDRLYNSEDYTQKELESAKYTLYNAVLVTLKLFAPFLVHITEEIYQSFFRGFEGHKSIHLAEWPSFRKEWQDDSLLEAGKALLSVISKVRRYKALNKLSMKAELTSIAISLPKAIDLSMFERELKSTLHVKEINVEEGDEVELLKVEIKE